MRCSDRAERVEQERSQDAKGVPNIGPLSKNAPAGFLRTHFRGAKPILLKIARKRSLATAPWKGALARGLLRPVSGIPARFGNIRSEATRGVNSSCRRGVNSGCRLTHSALPL